MLEALLHALEDAYLGVGVFVAATFALVFFFERSGPWRPSAWLARHPGAQVPIAALLGALPGCGGAVVVVTRYSAGELSFGAVAAVLTATMGDAAFLLLAREPLTGLLMIAVGFVVGTLWGWLIDAVHGKDFLRVAVPPEAEAVREPQRLPPALWMLWGAVLVPGLVFGIWKLTGSDPPALWAQIVGVGGALLSLLLWAASPTQATALLRGHRAQPVLERVARNTNYVTVWVVLGFFAYELATGVAGWDLAGAFATVPALLPLMGAVVGFLPGCGPQIVVTTLYLQGAIPLSAQVANAISNDGDALFPAIAVAPRAAILATLYTAVPALVLGYGIWLLLE